MKKIAIIIGLFMSLANAWAAERYSVTESVLLDADAEKVWSLIKDFGMLDSWHPAVTKDEIIQGEVPLRGTIRMLTIGDNQGTVQETLTSYSDEAMQFSYVINTTDIVPVKDYSAGMSVVGVGENLSLVIWSGNFLSNPPEGQGDEISRDTISGFYRAGLDNLTTLLAEN